MKLLTINTHSIIEAEYEKKLDVFIDAIYRIKPDVIAMQEVNQRMTSPIISIGDEYNVRNDNHAFNVCRSLHDKGLSYSCFWRGIKEGYGKLDEGIAILSRLPVVSVDTFYVSRTDNAKNWRTRRVLGIKIDNDWFYSVHLGRYDDGEEPFSEQWKRLTHRLAAKSRVWLMGDFNCDAGSIGYETVIASGWYDTFSLAESRDSGMTVQGKIDGWHDADREDMRIDYIFSNYKGHIKSSNVIFNGTNEAVISDHYGVLVEIDT